MFKQHILVLIWAVNTGMMWWSSMDEEWLECLHVCKGAWIIDTVTGYRGSFVKLLHRCHLYERPVCSHRAYSSLFSMWTLYIMFESWKSWKFAVSVLQKPHKLQNMFLQNQWPFLFFFFLKKIWDHFDKYFQQRCGEAMTDIKGRNISFLIKLFL